jgi:NAD(P)-dependent dehydrogenase (short-subunit alcohol dehydrogenase family)
MNRLDGKAAVVTGAARGIGLAISRALGREGAAVCLADIDEGQLQGACQKLQAEGIQVRVAVCDVTSRDSVRTTLLQAAESLGGLDILVNNAAAYTPTLPFQEINDRQWDEAFAVNVTGAFLMSQEALRYLRQSGKGAIVNVASQLGLVAAEGQAAYCASKGALIQLTRAMSLDLARFGIRVNAVCPGGTATERLARRFGSLPEAERKLGARHPIGRLARPEEIGPAVVYLASDDASFVTGSSLVVDGGYTAI